MLNVSFTIWRHMIAKQGLSRYTFLYISLIKQCLISLGYEYIYISVICFLNPCRQDCITLVKSVGLALRLVRKSRKPEDFLFCTLQSINEDNCFLRLFIKFHVMTNKGFRLFSLRHSKTTIFRLVQMCNQPTELGTRSVFWNVFIMTCD